ncbi:MAG: 3-methyl-2-oxobutanoate hydroxymethyltransferase [Desulfobacterales bacterium]|jgi:3-methyl-2-oxobutanoate hydroxymethyltransferase|nr:3-methyl-2-oxobutanoate hydroxymethyltransferase [Desulfobacterales bacterium]
MGWVRYTQRNGAETIHERGASILKKITIHTLLEKKKTKQAITWLTAYDFPMAQFEEKAGIDIILVGDSIGMTTFGYDSTLPVTMDLLIPHTQAVRKGAPNVFLIGDMPYMTYQVCPQEAVRNAGRFMAECGCDAIKLEGGREVLDTIRAIIRATVPVVGHLGLTPQSIAMLGGFKAQGRDAAAAVRLIEDAQLLEEAGVCMILLEAVPPEVAKIVTERAQIPIVGIGAGPHVDGQCLIVHDMLGMFEAFTPKFVKKYANIGGQIVTALKEFTQDVARGGFPAVEHCYKMPEAELLKLKELLKNNA